jgi:uncharacterized damage-inducible protein DinB
MDPLRIIPTEPYRGAALKRAAIARSYDAPGGTMSYMDTLTRYKAWANERIFSATASLPEGEATKTRKTRFGNIVHTLNHVYVIDRVFQAHLQGRPHPYQARNTPAHPPLAELAQAVDALDRWYVDYASTLSSDALAERIRFEFIGGGDGIMSREEMVTHVVNHATYHRGMVAEMMREVPVSPPVTDLTVFLRDNSKD